MTYVVRRFGHSIAKDGTIRFRERRVSWRHADAVAGRHLDRRKNYAIISGQVCSAINWTAMCSGCSDAFCDDRGAGCRECGHKGRVRQSAWMPHDGSEPR